MATQFIPQKKFIRAWLDKHNITNYTVLPDGSVDVRGGVDLSYNAVGHKLAQIPVKFNEIRGSFDCGDQDQLKTLDFAPRVVQRDFWCVSMGLTSLEHCPEKVGGNFLCAGNDLQNLEFCPKEVGKDFVCVSNPALGDLQQLNNFREIYEYHCAFLKSKTEKALLEVSLEKGNLSTQKAIKI